MTTDSCPELPAEPVSDAIQPSFTAGGTENKTRDDRGRGRHAIASAARTTRLLVADPLVHPVQLIRGKIHHHPLNDPSRTM